MGGTVNRALYYGAALIGTYLVLYHATGAGTLLKSGTSGAVGLTKALQGR